VVPLVLQKNPRQFDSEGLCRIEHAGGEKYPKPFCQTLRYLGGGEFLEIPDCNQDWYGNLTEKALISTSLYNIKNLPECNITLAKMKLSLPEGCSDLSVLF
jgi:hypothetical protein